MLEHYEMSRIESDRPVSNMVNSTEKDLSNLDRFATLLNRTLIMAQHSCREL